MFYGKQSKLGLYLTCILVLFTFFCVSTSYAHQFGAGASVNLRKLDKPAAVEAYKAISSIAVLAFMKHLTDPNDTDALEKVVTLSDDFIKNHPSSERIGEVYYYYGKALTQLDQVERGIDIFKKLIANVSPDHIATTYYSDGMVDALKWRPYEHGLLELGLAYDKQKTHDKADAVYKKLITNPDYAGGVQAQSARQILETDITSRTGEDLKSHIVWKGKTAPNFWMRHGEISLKHYQGKIVLLYYGTTDPQNLILKQLHDKYKDQNFQIISVNPDVAVNPVVKAVETKADAWIHFRDTHGKIADMYQIRTLPAVFLLDSDGVVQETHIDAATLEKAVAELVEENLNTYADPRTQKIVTKAVEAHGGFEKLQAVENMVMNVSLFEYFPDGDSEMEGYGKVYHYPDQFRAEFYTNEGERAIQLFDGTSLYVSEGGKLQQLPDEEVKHVINRHKDMLFHEPIWLLIKLAQKKIPIQYAGTETVNDESAVVLRVRQPSGKPLKIFISEETHLIVKYIFSDGRVDTVQSFKQYKEVDGIIISHQTIFKNESHNEVYISDISFNAKIDPKLFDPKN